MKEVLSGNFLSGFLFFVSIVFFIGCFCCIAFPYSSITTKIIAVCRNICISVLLFGLSFGTHYLETDEIITKKDTPIEYTIIKGNTEKHISSGAAFMCTYYAFGIDTNNVFSFYYAAPSEQYGLEFIKESIVMNENFHIREIDEDKCYVQIQGTQHYKVYKSKLLGTVEVNIGEETEAYLYVPAGTLSSGGEIILD